MISFILLLFTTSIVLFLVIKNYKETRVRFKIDVTNNDKRLQNLKKKKLAGCGWPMGQLETGRARKGNSFCLAGLAHLWRAGPKRARPTRIDNPIGVDLISTYGCF